MTIKQFLTIIAFATFLCWAALGVVMFNVDPFEATQLTMLFFYLSFFLAISGTTATAMYAMYHFFGDVQIPVFRYVKKSVLQGTIVGSSLTGLMLLQGMGILNPWILTFIVLLLAFFASLAFSHKKQRTV